MKLLDSIRSKYGQYILNRDASHTIRKLSMRSYSEARTFALLFHVSQKDDLDLLKNVSRSLKADQKNVFELVYVENNEKQALVPPAVNRSILQKKDLNWFRKPNELLIEKVADLNLDFIIDMTTSDFFPFIYLVATSKAHLRMGLQSDIKLRFYDFMINTQTESAELLSQYMMHYLKMINTSPNE